MTLAELKQRLTIPVIGAPLFIVSNPDLVMAQCTSGIVGAFPALNARPVEVLEQWLQRLTTDLAAWDNTFAVVNSTLAEVTTTVTGPNGINETATLAPAGLAWFNLP